MFVHFHTVIETGGLQHDPHPLVDFLVDGGLAARTARYSKPLHQGLDGQALCNQKQRAEMTVQNGPWQIWLPLTSELEGPDTVNGPIPLGCRCVRKS